MISDVAIIIHSLRSATQIAMITVHDTDINENEFNN